MKIEEVDIRADSYFMTKEECQRKMKWSFTELRPQEEPYPSLDEISIDVTNTFKLRTRTGSIDA